MTSSNAVRLFHAEPTSFRVLRWIVVPLVGVHVVLASWSGYRAIVQVYGVAVRASTSALRPGTVLHVDVASSGRVTVGVVVELRQGARAETLAVERMRTHATPSYDPRTVRGSWDVALTPDHLRSLTPGPTLVRVTASGRSQWLRVPPPVIRELHMVVEP